MSADLSPTYAASCMFQAQHNSINEQADGQIRLFFPLVTVSAIEEFQPSTLLHSNRQKSPLQAQTRDI
jgi:hypothetical protein